MVASQQFVTLAGSIRVANGLDAFADPDVLAAIGGSPYADQLAALNLRPADVVVTLDLPRYDRWLLELSEHVQVGGARVIAITNSALSPLAAHAQDGQASRDPLGDLIANALAAAATS